MTRLMKGFERVCQAVDPCTGRKPVQSLHAVCDLINLIMTVFIALFFFMINEYNKRLFVCWRQGNVFISIKVG